MPTRERTIRAEGIVLRHSDWGEADRLLVIFTRELGKVRAIAKGVRKPRSRKAGHLEPFTRVNLMLAKGRDLYIITQAVAVDAYLPLREDLLLFGYASYIVELLDRFTLDGDENPSIYSLVVTTIKRLSEREDRFLVVHYYEIRLLDLIGYRPELNNCVICGRKIQPENQFFSNELGGVICPACNREDVRDRPVSLDALRFLRHYQRSAYREARRARISASVREEIEAIMQSYLTYLLERSLNSPSFLRRMLREDDSK
ncbi:MAG: DNA repair protein RecO [Anaerolineales bacterium]|nr:DNA repair protein RecO [Anaerolineales bacterium]